MMFYERGDKSKKSSGRKWTVNMRTVTTEDNPYKVAGDILFASSDRISKIGRAHV